jgi:RimJ/RimL family protein N-acetyltransferase
LAIAACTSATPAAIIDLDATPQRHPRARTTSSDRRAMCPPIERRTIEVDFLEQAFPMLQIVPVSLSTDRLLLRPLDLTDESALADAASDGALWEKTTTTVPRPEGMRAYLETALDQAASGAALPFAIVVRDGERVVGTTRYMNIDAKNHRLEIGTTWVARSWQRSFVNTHAKFLLLRHAFEALGCIAVEFRTHILNHQSRQAIERLGAKQDGILRQHMIMPDGHIRDTVVYSIVKAEWPTVKAGLAQRLGESSPALT